MSKRSHVLGFRLGFIQLWNYTLNNYNKNLKVYIKSIVKKRYIQHCIQYISKSPGIFINVSKLCQYYNLLKLNFNYTPLKVLKQKKVLFPFLKVIKVLNKTFGVPVKLKIFKKKNNFNNAYFLSEYIKFRYKINKSSLKIILNKLEKDFTKIINRNILYITNKGIKKGKIVGIKICCKGRLGSLRNPLTQTFIKCSGKISFLTLTNYVDYDQNFLFTKQGTYSLHVWIFYSNV